eukprot:729421-Amorphochlora_amoeboformis.AAC.2
MSISTYLFRITTSGKEQIPSEPSHLPHPAVFKRRLFYTRKFLTDFSKGLRLDGGAFIHGRVRIGVTSSKHQPQDGSSSSSPPQGPRVPHP